MAEEKKIINPFSMDNERDKESWNKLWNHDPSFADMILKLEEKPKRVQTIAKLMIAAIICGDTITGDTAVSQEFSSKIVDFISNIACQMNIMHRYEKYTFDYEMFAELVESECTKLAEDDAAKVKEICGHYTEAKEFGLPMDTSKL